MLPDSYGRIATDLRVSLTDKCNLRCAYCMPPEGLDWLPSPDLLTDTEVVRLVRAAVERLGVREVRFPRGEVPRRGAPAGPRAGRDRGPDGGPAPAPGDLPDHQRDRARAHGRGVARGGT